MNATALTSLRKSRVKMTMQVYRVDKNGTVIEDRGTVNVTDSRGQVPIRSVYPPCRCHLCTEGAETR